MCFDAYREFVNKLGSYLWREFSRGVGYPEVPRAKLIISPRLIVVVSPATIAHFDLQNVTTSYT